MAFDPNKITFFAKTDARGKNVQFGIKAKDRQRHVYVIGKTGMGKSTLLENMAVQDILNGEGLAFIDPHGSAAETLLKYIPEHRINDVLYFAPFDTEHPVSFNIMEDVGPDKRHLVVSGLMSVFKKIWIDAWSARMEYILQNTLMALLEYPGSTLLGVNRMLSDKDYRNLVVANVKDPGVKSFWVDEFAKYNERYMQEAGDAIKNKIGQFTANPIIRNIIGQPKSSFDIREMMDNKKILIMNLSKGLIGESNANLLGSMLTTRIYLAAMSRADLSPEKMREMPNFYFFVDEFQSFANATFANILSEARKYHLNLTIAHQYITQMEEEVRDAVFGNVGTIVSFRVGPLDAEFLETIFTPQFLATDIVNLGFAQVYMSLMIDGIGSQPFSAVTLPPIAPPVVSCRDMAIAASRAQFSKVRAQVEEDIHKFHERVEVPKKEERRERPATAPLTPRPPRIDEQPRTEVRPVTSRVSREPETPRPPVHEAVASGVEAPKPVVVEIPPPETPVAPVVAREEPKASVSRNSGVPERNERLERTKPPQQKRAPQQVGDLRSVLKKIVESPEVSGEKRNGTSAKPGSEQNRSDLKAALSTVLAHTFPQATPATPEVAPREQTPAAMSVPEVPFTPLTTPIPASTPAPTFIFAPKPASPAPAPSESKMPTPKELERMMRVTTSDKPPLG
ncbi:type IV secretion system DNA-binding domain-containing protein [Candidatus Kaiserbacteria bacterium]|nr:MAG: type IV secretion system DNA-binding domain-containing protein [Candidatus Kaiserbacteria bacterium]